MINSLAVLCVYDNDARKLASSTRELVSERRQQLKFDLIHKIIEFNWFENKKNYIIKGKLGHRWESNHEPPEAHDCTEPLIYRREECTKNILR